jgi:PTS system mannitol-specific IIC component
VPGAIIIQFLGGIHEIYFPYILMKPKMILAPICGSAAAILVFLATDAGLVATPAPGSIFAYAAVTPKGGWFGVFAGVLVAAAVSFAVGSVLLGFGRGSNDLEPEAAEAELAAAAEQSRANKPTRPAAGPQDTADAAAGPQDTAATSRSDVEV